MPLESLNKNEQQGDRYLLVLSILLGISVLKLTEVMALGTTLKAILADAQKTGLTASAVGVFVVVAAYLIFFVLVLLAVLSLARQMGGHDGEKTNTGELVAMCVGALGIAYTAAFAFMIYVLGTP